MNKEKLIILFFLGFFLSSCVLINSNTKTINLPENPQALREDFFDQVVHLPGGGGLGNGPTISKEIIWDTIQVELSNMPSKKLSLVVYHEVGKSCDRYPLLEYFYHTTIYPDRDGYAEVTFNLSGMDGPEFEFVVFDGTTIIAFSALLSKNFDCQ